MKELQDQDCQQLSTQESEMLLGQQELSKHLLI